MTVKVEVVKGGGGLNLQINDYRVAGNKNYGGGTVIHRFEINEDDLKIALPKEFLNRLTANI